MKRMILAALAALMMLSWGLARAGCPSYAEVDPDNAATLKAQKEAAQELAGDAKTAARTGDYDTASTKWLAAAEKHPETLCAAWYTWNAAAALVATKDASFDWRIDPKRARLHGSKALGLLASAEELAARESRPGRSWRV
jgi:hypothetical protein